MMKNVFLLSGALAFCVLGGACVTMSNQKRINHQYSDHTTDQISTFLISQDQKTLIVIGQSHHYFLSLTPTIKAVLQHPARPIMRASFPTLHLERTQQLTGQYHINIAASDFSLLPIPQQSSLVALGFQQRNHQRELPYQLTGTLKGQRYSAGHFKLPSTTQTFNHPYQISIDYQYDPLSKTADKLLSTPLAVTADGVMIVGLTAVAIVAAPFVGLAQLLK
ncbi:MAG: hypothetical protein RLY58_2023 [Pseudomonadota bacterium]|jgi:hypothetical protein